MVTEQIGRYPRYTKHRPPSEHLLYLPMAGNSQRNLVGSSWAEAYAVWMTNPTIHWAGVNAMSPTDFPTVLRQNFIGVEIIGRHNWDGLGAILKTLAVDLNLYLVSENCDIDGQPNPLLKTSSSRKLVSSWNNSCLPTAPLSKISPQTSILTVPSYMRLEIASSMGVCLLRILPISSVLRE